MSKHIAVLTMPAHGHVNPFLPLVRELTRRGHRVTWPTTSAFAAAVVAAGAEFVELPVGPPMQPPPGATRLEFNPALMARMADRQIAELRTTLPVLHDRFENDRPDAIVSDTMTPVGSLTAGLLDVPLIPVFASFASNEHYSLGRELLGAASGDAGDRVREFAASMGIERPIGGLFSPVIEDLNLVLVPQEFQYAGDTFDERFAFIGPSVSGREDRGDWTPPAPGTRLLFISLGTAMNDRPDFFATCLEAFGDTPWQVAMAVGERVDRTQLGPIPANVDVRPYFPQPAVLQHATAFVTHCGMNSTMEGLYHRVPLICAPQMGEQAATARRVEELGLGRRLPADPTAAALRAIVDAVADDPEIRANLDYMTRTITKAGGRSRCHREVAERMTTDQTALVTGATGTIGQAIAAELGARGAALLLTGRRKNVLDDVAADLCDRGVRVAVAVGDVTDPAHAAAAVAQAIDTFGPVTTLVNNAGAASTIGTSVADSDPEAWLHTLLADTYGPYLFARAILPAMVEAGQGRIITVASKAGTAPIPGAADYAVAKAAVIRLSENIALETRGTGVTAFSIHPGGVASEMVEEQIKRGQVARDRFRHTPDAAARMIADLADGGYDVLSGAYLDVDDDLDALAAERTAGTGGRRVLRVLDLPEDRQARPFS